MSELAHDRVLVVAKDEALENPTRLVLLPVRSSGDILARRAASSALAFSLTASSSARNAASAASAARIGQSGLLKYAGSDWRFSATMARNRTFNGDPAWASVGCFCTAAFCQVSTVCAASA